ncbi:hypothetical protein ACET6F_00895 [Aeromonas veronii]
MSENKEIVKIINDMERVFSFITPLVEKKKLKLDDQYKKINYTYYRVFCCHLESVYILTKTEHFSSAILLMRTMLEIFVKSYYFEFIEKSKGSNVEDFLGGEKDFPSFFMMTKALEEYEHELFGNFKESFKQFTKTGLASYEKFSLFSHGRGEVLRAFYNSSQFSCSTEQISDVLLTAKGLFEQLSLLLLFTQNKSKEIGVVLTFLGK